MTQQINFKQIIQQSLPLIKEWLNIQTEETKQTEQFKEANKVIIEIENEKDFSETAYEDIKYILRPFQHLPLNIKRLLNISMMHQYSMFIAARYFDSIDDYINLILGIKNFQQILTKFFYNPISLNQQTVKFFPSIQTFHCYQKEDEYLKNETIVQYVDWNNRSWSKVKEIRKQNEGKKCEFKNVTWTQEDTENEYKTRNPFTLADSDDYYNWKLDLTIPEEVNNLEQGAFYENAMVLHKLLIPSTIKTIPKKCIEDCDDLTNITLPLNESQIICGNKIFKKNEHFIEDIFLPNSIKVINGQTVSKKSLVIPSFVTSLDETCLLNYNYKLSELIIPDSVKTIPKNLLMRCWQLKKITIPLGDSLIVCGTKIFKKNKHFEQYIHLPDEIEVINDVEVNDSIIEIPTFVTSIDENCLNFYMEQLIIPDSVKSIPKKCLINCIGLSNITLPLNESHIICGNKIFEKKEHLEQYIYLPQYIQVINNQQVDGSSFIIPSFITSLSDYCLQGWDYLQELTIPESIKTISQGCNDNLKICEQLTKITLPLNETRIICGNKIFTIPHFKQFIHLPESIQLINDVQV